MVGSLMELVLLSSLQRGDHVVPGNIWEGVLLLGLVVALIVVLMATGLVIARLGTGRINAIAVEKGVI